jgi:hypothetical protein
VKKTLLLKIHIKFSFTFHKQNITCKQRTCTKCGKNTHKNKIKKRKISDMTKRTTHYCKIITFKVKVKLSRYRPGQALGVPGGSASRICRQSAQKGGKVVSPTHRPSLPPGQIPGTRFC